MNIVSACHYIAQKGLVQASSGNISERLSNGLMKITVSGAWFDLIKEDDFAICDIDLMTVHPFSESKRPSSEFKIHAEALKVRKDMDIVLHFQSFNATALACSDFIEDTIDFESSIKHTWDIIPEIPYYINAVKIAPYCNPGSEESIENIVKTGLSNPLCNMVMIKNHGMFTIGKTFEEVIKKAMFFELACGIILNLNGTTSKISREEISLLRAKAI